MEQKHFFHVYANGDEAKNFIICRADFVVEFNLVATCAFVSKVTVVGFSIEDSHPHFLLYGTNEQSESFRIMYERSSLQHILSTRKTIDGVVLNISIDEITDDNHLKNIGTYVICQATKDGKPVMPYDYLWGTGSMYFRRSNHIPIWQITEDGVVAQPVEIGTLPTAQQQAIRGSRSKVPLNWLVCNGYILPSNYVDVKLFESIYRTHNCFRTFMSRGKNKDATILQGMATSRGVLLEDLEARRIAENVCYELFRKKTSRWLDTNQRLQFAMELNRRFRLTHRQISTIARLPEAEISKYVK